MGTAKKKKKKKSILEIFCGALTRERSQKDITAYNVFWESSVFLGRNLHLGREDTYLESPIQIYVYT